MLKLGDKVLKWLLQYVHELKLIESEWMNTWGMENVKENKWKS